MRLMRQQAAVHIDETGWRIDGQNHWLWVFVNDIVALYLISRKGTQRFAEEAQSNTEHSWCSLRLLCATLTPAPTF